MCALQLPLAALLFGYACDAERTGRRGPYVALAAVFSLLFCALTIEDVVLATRYGPYHATDSGFVRIGVRAVSATLFIVAAVSWAMFRLARPKAA